ncbi:transcriptional regulator BetI [Reinekea blandensis]|uniref:HTH-type transcriptional regulator BetI n=1 Tax=Reinekea blandensis MED297 TaxID=314283 RepID=A4BG40_9GAMM|nr:transcriptional regulator BetI [Reinekea blandensis]EAR08835.1 Transcriptional regulator [Reinekea sp. MED297] [Reinekea blandensis MED297]
MPKVGMKPIRQSQLIEATLEAVETYGLQGTTINTISKLAGVSTGIINHYFGGKQGLLEATVRYLLQQLHVELMKELKQVDPNDAMARLNAIVAANFAQIQVSDKGSKTWLAFWSQAMHNPEFARLQRVNERRLLSNLKHSFRQLIPAERVEEAAQTTAALIDGLWLRRALSDHPLSVADSAQFCMNHVQGIVQQFQMPQR